MTRVHQPNTLCWIDLGTPDPEAAAVFYQTVFGWTIDVPDATGYRLCRLDGLLVCALGPAEDPGTPYWTTYVSVSAATNTVAGAVAAGGRIIAPPAAVERVGTFAILADSMNTPLSVWQPEGLAGVETDRRSGSWVASHLVTDDPDRTRSFYQSVFGWTEHDGQFFFGEYAVASVGALDTVGLDAPNWFTIFGTSDLQSTLDKVISSGGGTIGHSTIGVDVVTIVADDQGTPFGITTTPTRPIPTARAT